MYSRILVPLDGSDLAEHALPFVITLSRGLDCAVDLLRIPANEPMYISGDFSIVPPVDEAMSAEERKQECQEYLDDVAGTLREKGLTVSTKVRTGLASDQIVAEAATVDETMIIMASHGRSGVARWVMGSVADAVLRGSGGPLLLVRPPDDGGAGDPRLRRIVAPVDGSLVAEQVLPHVAGLAKALDVGVDLVRVTPSAAEYYRSASVSHIGGTPANLYPAYQEFIRSTDAEAQTYLNDTVALLEAQGVSPIEMHLFHGQPASVISDMARTHPGNMVVIATHGRSGIGRWVLGSVADSVVRHSGCPVLLIRAQESA